MASEKRFIDANFPKSIIQEYIGVSDYQLFKAVMRKVCDILDHCPTVDATEVVRCKDCKWYAPNNDGSWLGCAFDTRHPDDVPKENDFCSYGERMEDNG